MKKKLTKVLSVLLCVLMLLSSAPLDGIAQLTGDKLMSLEASAGERTYCSTAAAQWAKDHCRDYNSVLLGTGYWNDGGDCANFVSQCLYMGGMDMSTFWNTNGYLGHWTESEGSYYAGSFVRCKQLYNFLTDHIGAQSIRNPSASQVSIGDVIIYYRSEVGRMGHSAIVVDIINGVPQIAYHSTGTKYDITTDWHLGFSGSDTYLIKLNGKTCVNENPRRVWVYRAGGGDKKLYNYASTGASRLTTFLSGEYALVTDFQDANGYTWGKTFRYGKTGWVKLSSFNYQGYYASAPVDHLFGSWEVVKVANCQQDGLSERVCKRCGYTETKTIKGGHITDPKATCLTEGICKICGVVTENPLGHDWDKGTITTSPTCLEDGVRTYVCKRDASHTYTEPVEKLGHDYIAGATAPTCVANGTKTYKCSRCDDSYIDYIDENNTWSDWTTDIVAVPASRVKDYVKAEVQIRYADKVTTTSYETSLDGYTRDGGEWKEQSRGTIDYAASWPSGYRTSNNSLYDKYNKSPKTGSENETTKTTVDTSTIGYIYWHWCRNNQSLGLGYNRSISDCYTSEFNAFHQWYSTSNVSFDSGANAYYSKQSSVCNDSYWWNTTRVTIKRCSYVTYKKLFNYWKWNEFGQWTKFEVPGTDAETLTQNLYNNKDEYLATLKSLYPGTFNSTDSKKVEVRVVYSYDLAAMGHDFSVQSDKVFDKTDTLLSEDEINSTCYSVGATCSRCGAVSPDAEKHNHIFPNFNTQRDKYTIFSQNDITTVYRADCENDCGCYILKSVDNHNFVVKEVVEPTCNGENGTEGYTVYKCANHSGEEYNADFVPALKDDYSHDVWEVTKNPSCDEAGLMICKCARFDACGHFITKEIPPLGHKMTKFDSKDRTCTQDGNEEYYYCSGCDKYFSDAEGKNEISENSWVIPASDHNGKNSSGDDIWVVETEAGCGRTGWKRVYCVNEWCDEITDCDKHSDGHGYIIKEEEIPEIVPDYYVYDAKDAEYDPSYNGETEFDKWVSTTCDHNGIIYITCRNCENTENRHGIVEGDTYTTLEARAIPHLEGEWIIDEEAYCIYDGFRHKVCDRCGVTLDEETIPAPCDVHHFENKQEDGGCIYKQCRCCGLIEGGNHNFVRDGARDVAPDCINEGLKAYTCSICNLYNDEKLPALGHDCTVTSSVDPTCTEDGYDVYTCQRKGCGYIYNVSTEGALGHDYSKGYKVIKKGTCTADGEKELRCSRVNSGNVCGYLDKTVTIPARNHSMGERYEYLVSGTQTCYRNDCLNTENSEYESCSFYTTSSHAYGKWVYDGEKAKTHTKVCANYNNHIETENCTFKSNVTRKADCVNDGERLYTCVVCGGTYTTVIKARNHSFGEWYTVTEAKCEKAGLERRDCVHTDSTDEFNPCDKYETRVINAKGHTEGKPVQENYVAPKCEIKGGYDTVVYCSDCGKELSRVHTDINPLDHDWDDGVKDPDSDCTKEGSMLYTCKRDSSHTKRVAISAKGHVAGQMKVTTKASCIADGLKEQKCTVCGAVLATEVIKARIHNMTEWHVTKEATCTEKGQEQRECLNTNETELYTACDLVETRETAVNPDNHNLVHHDAKAPTCEEDGYKAYDTCSRCDYTTYEVVKAHGHDYNKIDSKCVAPNCENDGYDYYECSYDASHNYTVTVKANGHTPGQMKVTTKASCTADGLKEQKCTVCSKVLATEVIKARNHNMNEWHVTKEATCTEKGQEQRECLNTNETELYTACDLVETRETAINPDNHNLVHHDAKAPTCEEDGYKAYDTCSRCDYTTYEVVKAHGHDYNKIDSKCVAPNCENDGYDYYECSYDASHNYKVDTEKLGHREGPIVIENDIPATIDKDGSYEEVIYCSRCGKELSRIKKIIPRLISYTATFVVVNEDGSQTVVEKPVRFLPGTKKITAPSVPAKDGYIGEWEKYELKDEDIIIKAIYTLKSTDNESELETEKTSDYKDGIANITLSAFAQTRNAKVNLNAKAYDIVLIVDQSGSMEYYMDRDVKAADVAHDSRNAKLKVVAKDFVKLVSDNAKELNVNHRIAIVGFGMGSYTTDSTKYPIYNNTAVLTPTKTKFGKTDSKGNFEDMTPAFKNAFVSSTNTSVLNSAIDSIAASGATAADLGFEMAKGIFANDDSGNEKLVIFLTDGVPTLWDGFDEDVANRAINYSYLLKNNYNAKVYSVAISNIANPTNETEDFNKFLHYVSSNYPYARYGESHEVNDSKSYFLATTDAKKLSEIFSNVFAQTVSNTISFDKVTMYDTISKYFTLTVEQEEELRNNLKNDYGVNSEDIRISRNEDGTTGISVDICPIPVYDSTNTMTGYGASVSFNVSANENAAKAGIYDTNTSDAGVAKDGETVARFEVPHIKIPADRTYIEFIIGDEVYAIRDVSIGDKVEAPTTSMGAWNIPEGTVVTESCAKFYAVLSGDERVITWHIGNDTITQKYNIGQLITAPEVTAPSGKTFAGWDMVVPYRMPAYNLDFTAEFIKHSHNYKLTVQSGTCEDGIVRQYRCSCGDLKAEKSAPGEHQFVAIVTKELNKSVATMTCQVCGHYTEQYISYRASIASNKDTVYTDLTLYDAKNITVQPDGKIRVEIPLTTKQKNNSRSLKVYRVDKNGVNTPVSFTISGNYAVLILDHFSYYVLTLEDEEMTYEDVVCALNGHTYTSSVTAPTCVGEGYTTYSCSNCGETYKDNYIAATGHTASSWITDVPNTCEVDGSAHKECKVCSEVLSTKVIEKTGHKKGNDGKCLNCGADLRTENEKNCTHICHRTGKFYKIIWKIILVFCKLFKINKVCACGKIHY